MWCCEERFPKVEMELDAETCMAEERRAELCVDMNEIMRCLRRKSPDEQPLSLSSYRRATVDPPWWRCREISRLVTLTVPGKADVT